MTSHTPDPSQPTSQSTEKPDNPTQPIPEATPKTASPKPKAPKPSAIPRPPAGVPVAPSQPKKGTTAANQAPAPAPAAPPVPTIDEAEADDAAKFGRVDAEGNVYVTDPEAADSSSSSYASQEVDSKNERIVGQFPDVPEREALQLYITRYLDLLAQVKLFQTRVQTVSDLTVSEIDTTINQLREQVKEPAAVGDLAKLRQLLKDVEELAAERRKAIEIERAAAREKAIAERTKIVEMAEELAAKDPQKIQWRKSGDALKHLLEEWKAAQRQGPRIDKPTEDSLWKRFSTARTTFDRSKRHFFAELSKRNAAAKAEKTVLVEEAEKLANSTNWDETARAYRKLMDRWRAAGHAGRKDDDALWARFRTAQDTFFEARNAVLAEENKEFEKNLEVKLEILTEAEALLPIKDVKAARRALRRIQERWDDAGKVPRENLRDVEGRLRTVVNAIKDAEDEAWKRNNPETKARAQGAAAQLEESITQLEDEVAAAEAAGNDKKAKQAREALEVRKSWMTQISQFADE